jgi:hypothetical protein
MRLSDRVASNAPQTLLGAQGSGIDETLGSGLDILWGVSGLDAKVKQMVPYVDEARLTLGQSGRRGKNRRMAPRLVVRKDVGERLQLKYNGALDELDDHMVSLEYKLSEVARIEGGWVSISDVPAGDFGLDLRLRWEFD